MTYALPTLPYKYNALEPWIDETTMKIHHTKHHQGYVDKLNAAINGTKLEDKPIKEILSDADSIPGNIRTAVINNGGGHVNHSLFWEEMITNPRGNENKPAGNLSKEINQTFGGFEKFKEVFSNAALTRFGSGWAWLIMNKNKKLEITSTPNQDSPLMDGNTPILGLDVWEHAYYLKYQNKRPDYVSAFFNVINWKKAEELFNELSK